MINAVVFKSARWMTTLRCLMLCIWCDQVGAINYELESEWYFQWGLVSTWYSIFNWSERCAKNGHSTPRDTLPYVTEPVKTYASSMGSSTTRYISQIWYPPIVTCSGRWHMVWLFSKSTLVYKHIEKWLN